MEQIDTSANWEVEFNMRQSQVAPEIQFLLWNGYWGRIGAGSWHEERLYTNESSRGSEAWQEEVKEQAVFPSSSAIAFFALGEGDAGR